MRTTVCYVASYDPDYSRNLDTIRALRAAGVRVEVVRGSAGLKRSSGSWSALWPARAGLRQILGAVMRVGDVTLRLLRCRVLFVGYFGQLDMLLLAPIARAVGRPVIFNPLVTLNDTVVEDRKLVGTRSPQARALLTIDRLSLRLADLVLTDTQDNSEYLSRISGLPDSRTFVVPVGVDETLFFPPDIRGERAPGELDVLFYGTFIPLHGVETIIRAAAILNNTRPGMRFELVGTGQQYAAARELAARLDATNIRWTDWLPYSGLGRRLREADVALGVFDGGEKASRVIPNKVHQALACGIPVVTRESPAVSRLLDNGGSAMLVPPDDPEALADALCRLADDPSLRRDIGARGRLAWKGYASDERLAGLVGTALDRVGIT